MAVELTGKAIYQTTRSDLINSLVAPKAQIKYELVFMLRNVYQKLEELVRLDRTVLSEQINLPKLNNQELLDLFLETDAQEYLIDISPNGYWAWAIIDRANLFQNKKKFTKDNLEQAAKRLKQDFNEQNCHLTWKFPNSACDSEIHTLISRGYLLTELKDQNLSIIINPLLKADS